MRREDERITIALRFPTHSQRPTGFLHALHPVTGGSGFIGSHCILQLLAAGHEVRTTVRNLQREADVRAILLQIKGT